MKKGYDLINDLQKHAAETQRDEYRETMLAAAEEIRQLIKEKRRLETMIFVFKK